MRIIVTRPKEDAKALTQRLQSMGCEVMLEPLLHIQFLDGPTINLDGVQALLATSANGVRALARRCPSRSLPVFAVGDASARAAQEAGFSKIISASGNVDTLAIVVADHLNSTNGGLLHAAGSKVAGDLKGLLEAHGFTYQRQVLYQAQKSTQLSEETTRALEEGNVDGVLLFSPRTGRAFVDLLDQANLKKTSKNIHAFCLSQAVADTLDNHSWRDVIIAENPDQESLLAALSGIC